jgi:hypothetical protein
LKKAAFDVKFKETGAVTVAALFLFLERCQRNVLFPAND